jgi:hypothetical protein
MSLKIRRTVGSRGGAANHVGECSGVPFLVKPPPARVGSTAEVSPMTVFHRVTSAKKKSLVFFMAA